MEKLRINSKRMNIIENLYFIMFMTYAILSTNSFTYGKPIISLVMWPTFLIGILIIAYRALNFKDYCKMPGLIFLIGMLASIGISTVVNYRYSFKSNIIVCVYWALFFLVCYVKYNEKTKEEIIKDFEYIAAFFAVYFTVGAVLGILLMFEGVSVKMMTSDTNYEYFIGFIHGRLWGTYINPNNGAISSAVSIIIFVYLFSKSKKLLPKIGCSAAVLLLLMYIALSDSRSGAVCVGVVCGVYSFVRLGYKFKDKKALLKIVGAMISVLIIIPGFMAPRCLKNVYNDASVKISEYRENNSNDVIAENNDVSFKTPVIDRGYDLSDDVSNRRFDVWKSGVEIFSSSSKNIIVGIGFNGILDYAEETMPETYIVSNDYTKLRTLDNEFFNILDAQGIIGIIATAAFVIFIITVIFKRLFSLDEEYASLVAVLLAVVIGLGASAMFCAVMFYHFSANSILFWFTSGTLIYLITKDKKARINGEN